MGCTPSKPTPGARGTPSSMRRASAAAKIAAATPEPPPSEKPRRGTVPAMASLSEEKQERMDRALDSSAQGGARSSYSLRVESEFDAAFDGQANGGLSHSAAEYKHPLPALGRCGWHSSCPHRLLFRSCRLRPGGRLACNRPR